MNLAARKRAADQAEAIVSEETESFERWRRSLTLAPTIKGLRDRFLHLAMAELARTKPRLTLSERDEQTLDAMMNTLVNKLLHRPISELKAGEDDPETTALIDATRRLFDLEERRSLPPETSKNGAFAKQEQQEQEGAEDGPVLGELAGATGRGESR
jgi:glutamyl-tRNA reductase